ncbi:MAG: hypothetical protein CME65_07605 [Halobacteriovoraceae bacterium]|nr:hypothetical protein [Halobacteriovoraceae bacterium]|tara:strand:+ start:2251 stop:3171 length:921 start_codon:yes stop_codon:yes gene_type:complete
MKMLMLFSTVLLSASAFAQSAYEFCYKETTFRSDRQDCLRVVQTGSFDRSALNFCSENINSDGDKVDCLVKVKNNHFGRSALDACAEMTFPDNKLACLDLIARKHYRPDEANYCSNLWPDREIRECLEYSGRAVRSRPRRGSVRRTETEVRRRGNRTVVTETVYDHNEYTTCYERPRTRLIQYQDQRQARRGRNTVIGGLIGIGVGQIIGGDEGDIVSAIGAGVALYGAIEIADSREIIYQDNGYDCRSYYTVDTRTYTRVVNNRRCTTTRYYTNRWGSTHEYFETNCNGSRYMSFERNSDIWYAN